MSELQTYSTYLYLFYVENPTLNGDHSAAKGGRGRPAAGNVLGTGSLWFTV
jgi:hypothetical protein